MTEPDPQTRWEYVGFWSRLGAFLVDALLIIVCTWMPLIIFHGWDYLLSKRFVPAPLDLLWSHLLPSVAVVLFWYFRSATPGKILIGALVVDAATGKRPTFGQCVMRLLGYYLSFFAAGLGFAWIAVDARKQGWHDKLARTVVVRKDHEASAPEAVDHKLNTVVAPEVMPAG